MTVIICAIISSLAFGVSVMNLIVLRRMNRIEAGKDFTETEKGQIRQILNMMMFDGNPHEN